MSVDQFRDDDQGYLAWTAAHPGGYVINIERSLNPGYARLHRADCYTINGHPAPGRTWTGPYIKICSALARELQDWARTNLSGAIPRCGSILVPHDHRHINHDRAYDEARWPAWNVLYDRIC